ncbi:glycoprotein Xg [Sarcoramphus papa]
MGKFRSILLLCLGFLLVHVRGQRDFDLADALDHPEDIITRKPTVIRRPTRPVLNNDLHLGDALGGGDIPRKPLYPPLPPRPGSHSNSGGFDDSDLLDGKPLPPHITGEEEHHFNHGGNTDSGLVAGVTSPIISAFVILVVGSIAAYSAYKNKKLCFKPHVAQCRKLLPSAKQLLMFTEQFDAKMPLLNQVSLKLPCRDMLCECMCTYIYVYVKYIQHSE